MQRAKHRERVRDKESHLDLVQGWRDEFDPLRWGRAAQQPNDWLAFRGPWRKRSSATSPIISSRAGARTHRLCS